VSPPPPSSSAVLACPLLSADTISYPAPSSSGTIYRGIRFCSKLAAASGPGYLIAVGYMDPGNWATDIAGGSKFGFALLPVIVISNFAAMFLQWLALRLGIATGRDLAQLCRDQYSRPIAYVLWATCEIAIVACDLAEVIGTAIALKLLFHMPMLIGASLTAFDTLLLMGLQKSGFRKIEAVVIALVGLIGACFIYELLASHPPVGTLFAALIPSTSTPLTPLALYISLGIFGATVMPHNLYLHSSIAQTRVPDKSAAGKRDAIRFSTIDMCVALGIALFINAAILITAASAFHWSGHSGVETIEDAYKLLSPALGAGAASVIFAVALLAAGQNSTLTGTMAGQIVMEGFLKLRINPCVRRLITRGIALAPVIAVTAIAGEAATAKLLVFSQVILSLQLGFAVVPLVAFTSSKALMGNLANSTWVKSAGYALAVLIVCVNAWLVIQTMTA
jgi:manganese transport protein